MLEMLTLLQHLKLRATLLWHLWGKPFLIALWLETQERLKSLLTQGKA